MPGVDALICGGEIVAYVCGGCGEGYELADQAMDCCCPEEELLTEQLNDGNPEVPE